jgi:hypothetical protein
MNRFHQVAERLVAPALLFAILGVVGTAHADDVPSPCSALTRIVAARPGGFSTLTPADGHGIAQPYGSDAQCGIATGAYRCEWTPNQDAGTGPDALEGVAADIAACLPDATHDVNSPARQHFYIGERGNRTEITVTQVAGGRVRLMVSGR